MEKTNDVGHGVSQEANQPDNRPRTSPSKKLLFMHMGLEPHLADYDMSGWDLSEQKQKYERLIKSMFNKMWGADANPARFSRWVQDSCNISESNHLTVALSLFHAALHDFGYRCMEKSWNIIADFILCFGSLPDPPGVIIFFAELSKEKFPNWKKLISEEDNPNSSGPTLVLDYSPWTPLLTRISQIGQRPKSISDLRKVNDGNSLIRTLTDYHAWCVDENNEVYDYPVEQIAGDSLYWTPNVIRRPFDAELVCALYESVVNIRAYTENHILEIEHLTQEQKMDMISNDAFPKNCCIDRALTIRDSDPDRFSMVIGSLGFVQPDGSIFWAYG